MERRDSLCDFSHPSIPIRVKALQMYRDVGGATANPEALQQIDAAISDLAKLMERKPSDPEELHKLNYILAGGMLVGHSDDQGLGHIEMQAFVEMLLPLTSDPEEAIASITTVAQAEEMFAASAAWMRDNTGELKFNGFRYLAIIAALEGMTSEEETLLYRMAEMTGIPRKAAADLIHEIMTNFASKKVTGGTLIQKLK